MSPQADYYPVGATNLWPLPKGFFDKTADELPERNQKQSSLFCLPIDIRLIIYEYALASDSRISMNGVVTTKAVSEKNFPAQHRREDILRGGHGPKSMHIVTPKTHIATDTLLWSPVHLSSNPRRNRAAYVRQTELFRRQIWL